MFFFLVSYAIIYNVCVCVYVPYSRSGSDSTHFKREKSALSSDQSSDEHQSITLKHHRPGPGKIEQKH